MEKSKAIHYECEPCTFWEATHAIPGFDHKDEKYKRCQNCRKRIEIYRNWIEKQEGGSI